MAPATSDPHTFASGTLSMAALLTLLTSSQGLLTSASKTNGGYAYNPATVPFFSELTKLSISAYLLRRQMRSDPAAARVTRSLRSSLLYFVPGLIYAAHNNVQFYFLKYVDPTTYQILGNLKIITTGLLLWLVLGRRMSPLQWIALSLLAVGATTSQISTDCESETVMRAPLIGYLFGLLSACLSALAAVYTEWVLKRNGDSLYWQNMQLYGFGVLFNGAGLVAGSAGSVLHPLKGYSVATWLVVANLAFSGLLVSWIMKFADSIVKVYATSLAMLLTLVVSIFFFSLHPTLQMGLGILVAAASVVLFYVPPEKLGNKEPGTDKNLPK